MMIAEGSLSEKITKGITAIILTSPILHKAINELKTIDMVKTMDGCYSSALCYDGYKT